MAAIPSITAYPMPPTDALPDNNVQWNLYSHRAVLLIHDMQNYFIRPFPEGQSPRRELLKNISWLRQSCARNAVPIAYTAQPGNMTKAERGLLADFWGAGMRREEEDCAIVEPLAPCDGDWRLTKWRYSAFFRSDLLARLRASGRDQLIVCGVYAHIGVLMTSADAFTNDIQPFLVADGIADFSADYHHLALQYAALRCARVQTTRWMIGHIEGLLQRSLAHRSTVR